MNHSKVHPLVATVKSHYTRAESVIHSWGHVTRTAQGAAWITKTMGGTPRQQELAYCAGMLHDIVRPVTEKKCHAQASAEKASTILEGEHYFSDSEKEKICTAIKDHRTPVFWNNLVHSSVYVADKVFEHMGAYLDFRAAVWAGELSHTDFKGLTPVQAVITYYKKSWRKFLTEMYPEYVKGIVDYQTQWNAIYWKALHNNMFWAVDMAETLFYAGRQKEDFDRVLHTFEPQGKQKKWTQEMRLYIAGKKYPFFRKMLKNDL